MEGADARDVRGQFEDVAADAVDAGQEILKRIDGVRAANLSGRIRVVGALGNGRDPVAGGCWGLKALSRL